MIVAKHCKYLWPIPCDQEEWIKYLSEQVLTAKQYTHSSPDKTYAILEYMDQFIKGRWAVEDED